jgi:pilus assembly protein Flp/PilA
MIKFLRRLCRNRRGTTAIEYGLIAALIVLAMLTALKEFAFQSTSMWNNVSTKVSNAG